MASFTASRRYGTLTIAKKKHMPRHVIGFQGYHDDLRPVLNRGSEPITIHPAALGEELEIQYREMQRIITENRLLVEDNTLLQTEWTAAHNETHRLGQVVLKLQAYKEAQGRELIEIRMKLEDELHASEPLKTEVLQLREAVQDLNALRQELAAQIQGLMQEIAQVEAENQQLASMRADADQMHEELVEARRAFVYKNKANEEQVGKGLRVEKKLYMAHRTEKLQAEELNVDRRAHGNCTLCPLCNYPNDFYICVRAEGYGMLNESLEVRYPASVFGNSYGSAVGPYTNHALLRR